MKLPPEFSFQDGSMGRRGSSTTSHAVFPSKPVRGFVHGVDFTEESK